MKINSAIRIIVQILFGQPPLDGQHTAVRQIPDDLDEITDSGLALREAIPVRSAEYWMEMGCPELAVEELETLNAHAR